MSALGGVFRKGLGCGVAALAFVCGAAPAFGQDAGGTSVSLPKWGAHIDFEGKLGTKRNLGEGDLFLPLAQSSDTLLFGDLRTRFDDKDSREGNFGIGVRHMLPSGWNLGVYGFYDRRRSSYDHYFTQLTFGAEALGRDYDVRANGYLPVSNSTKPVDSLNAASISGTSVVVRAGEEHALGGFDAEVGWRVPVFAPDADRQLRLYAGGYRFAGSGVHPIQGPRARLDFTLNDVPFLWKGARVTLGGEIQHDGPRGTQAFALVRLRVPLEVFGGSEPEDRLTAQERRMTDPLVRDVDVVTEAGAFGPTETATETAGGSAITVLSSSSTSGSALPGAVSGAGANSTVILSGTFNTTAAVTLQSGQTVMGAGSLTVKTPSGRTATLTTPAATVSASIGGSGSLYSNPAFLMANNSTLEGLTISLTRSGGAGAVGVYFTGISGATLENSTVTATETGANTGIGVAVYDASGITIRNNTITGTTGSGSTAEGFAIANGGGGAAATVTGNTLSASGGSSNNYYLFVNSGTINAGSTGNTRSNGTCYANSATGTAYFTDGSTCP